LAAPWLPTASARLLSKLRLLRAAAAGMIVAGMMLKHCGG
jgi:hypothetical protein